MRPAGLKPAVSLDAAECNSAGRTDREVYVPARAQRGTVFQRFASRAFFNLFQQNAQLCDCFQIFSSARRFLNAESAYLLVAEAEETFPNFEPSD